MANHFPPLTAMSVINVEYGIEVSSLTGNNNVSRAGSMSMMNYSFGRGTNADGSLSLDYSTFDQDREETAMQQVVTALAAAWAGPGALALTEAQILAAITITRTWTFTTTTPLPSGAFGQATVAETITISPPAPAAPAA